MNSGDSPITRSQIRLGYLAAFPDVAGAAGR